MRPRTLGELLDMTPADFRDFGVAPEQREALAAERLYPEDVERKPGEELLDAFAWGEAVGIWSARYDIGQLGRFIGALQRRLGRQWVRF